MDSTPISQLLRYVIAGELRREYVLLPEGSPQIDAPGGNLIYAGIGALLWEGDIGLLGRVGAQYPVEWLDRFHRTGFDTRGILVGPDDLQERTFVVYVDMETRRSDNPVAHFARLGLPYPKELFDYSNPDEQLDSRVRMGPRSLRVTDIPSDFLDASAVHICPVDYLTHSLLPSTFRQSHGNTITMDPSPGYMNPIFWDHMPGLLNGLTAFLCSEEKMRALFKNRTNDLWEMAETLGTYGCEIIVIKRGSRGQLVYDAQARTRWQVPPYPIQVVDPTGAGDAFCGGFLVGYRNTYDALQAALYGNVSASLVIQGSGVFYALDSMPGLAQARLGSLQGMVQKV